MRVLHVVPTYLPATRYGGPIYSVHGLCRALASVGVETHVYTTNVDGSQDSDVPLAEPVDMDGVSVSYFRSTLGRRLYYSSDMNRALRQNISTFDVVHVHSVFLWPTLVACREARKAKVPYILAPRGMLVPELIHAKSRWLKSAWIRLFEASNVQRASALHLTSELEHRELNRVINHETPVWVVPNGVEMCGENRWSGSVTGDQVLFIGRINWKKGLDRLVRAFATGAMGQLTIAGNDEDGYLSELKTLVDEHELQSRIRFVGPVRGEQKEVLFREADLFVLPSVNENFGNVALEAMAEGCPVAASQTSGIVTEVPTGSLRVFNTDVQSIAETINACLTNPIERKALSKKGYAAASSLSWESIADVMTTRYETLIHD